MVDQDNQYWIFFDTSIASPDYYQDVHKVLSMPSGSVIRYDYKEKYISLLALSSIRTSPNQPKKVLFVYTQLKTYTRGEETPKQPPNVSDMFWLPIRTGELFHISNSNHKNILFNLKVLDYPYIEQNIIDQIISVHFSEGNTPFNKWVILSDDIENYNKLSTVHDKDDNNTNWESITNVIGSPPSQFVSDSFWKIKFEDYQEQRLLPNIRKKNHSISSYYSLKEDSEYGIRVQSNTPSDINQTKSTKLIHQRNIVIKSSDSNVIELENKESLRQSTEFLINFETKKIIGYGSRKCILELSTQNGKSDYYIGPEYNVDIVVTHKLFDLIVGLICSICASFFWAIPSLINNKNEIIKIIFIISSILLGLAAAYFLTRTIGFGIKDKN